MELHRQISGMQIICLLIWRDSIHDEVVALICIWIYWIREFKYLDTTPTWRRHYYSKRFEYNNGKWEPSMLHRRRHREEGLSVGSYIHDDTTYLGTSVWMINLHYCSLHRYWDRTFEMIFDIDGFTNPHKSVARFWRRRKWRTTWVSWFGMVQTTSVHNCKVIQLNEIDIGYSHRILSLTTSASTA